MRAETMADRASRSSRSRPGTPGSRPQRKKEVVSEFLGHRSASRTVIQCLTDRRGAGRFRAEDQLQATSGRGAQADWSRRRKSRFGRLSDAQPLQVLDRRPHLAGVPRRPVVALRQPRNPGAPSHGDQLDREMLRAVVLAQGQGTVASGQPMEARPRTNRVAPNKAGHGRGGPTADMDAVEGVRRPGPLWRHLMKTPAPAGIFTRAPDRKLTEDSVCQTQAGTPRLGCPASCPVTGQPS